MKTVKVNRITYWLGLPGIGEEVKLKCAWETVITNGVVHLEFKTTDNEWIADYLLFITETEEFLNEDVGRERYSFC